MCLYSSPENTSSPKDAMKLLQAMHPPHLMNGHHELLKQHKQALYPQNEASIQAHEEYLRNLDREDISDEEGDHHGDRLHGYGVQGMPLQQFNDDDAFEAAEREESENKRDLAVAVARESMAPMLMMQEVQKKLEAEGRSFSPLKQEVLVQEEEVRGDDESAHFEEGEGCESGETDGQKDESMSDSEVNQRLENGMEA